MKILIKNGLIVDPSQKIKKIMNLEINNGVISNLHIRKNINYQKFDEVIDAKGFIVAPGLVDIHVHLRDPGLKHKETITTGSRAAAAGGFTSIACMPNTSPANDKPKITKYIMDKSNKAGMVNIFPIGAITQGLNNLKLAKIVENIKAGCVGISDDGFPVTNLKLLFNAMTLAKKNSFPVISHCEDCSFSEGGVANEGKFSRKYRLIGIPNISEELGIIKDIAVAEYTNAHLHVCHVSTLNSVKIIKEAKARGVIVTCEATPHHFSISEDDILNCDTNYKMNPPLRTMQDVKAIEKGLIEGVIDVIATDHAPHAESEKRMNFKNAPFGIIGLETALPLSLKLVHDKKISISKLISLMSTRPSEIINIPKGTLKKGSDADLVIFDMNKPVVVDKNKMHSKSKNTPFNGIKLKGKVIRTILKGKTVYSSN